MKKLLYVSFAALALFAFACKKEATVAETPVTVQEEETITVEEATTEEATTEEATTEEATTEEATATE